MKIALKVIFFIILLVSCKKQQPATISEYRYWFSEPANGYVQQRDINGIIYSIQYRPVELQIMNEVHEDQIYNDTQVHDLIASYGNGLCFLLEVKPSENIRETPTSNNPFNVYSRPEYYSILSESVPGALKLITNQDTLSPTLFHLEREYELANKIRFLFTFPGNKSLKKQKILVIYDDNVFGAGRIRFRFDLNKLIIPDLPINIIKHGSNKKV